MATKEKEPLLTVPPEGPKVEELETVTVIVPENNLPSIEPRSVREEKGDK